jgi:hypothetical protein
MEGADISLDVSTNLQKTSGIKIKERRGKLYCFIRHAKYNEHFWQKPGACSYRLDDWQNNRLMRLGGLSIPILFLLKYSVQRLY